MPGWMRSLDRRQGGGHGRTSEVDLVTGEWLTE